MLGGLFKCSCRNIYSLYDRLIVCRINRPVVKRLLNSAHLPSKITGVLARNRCNKQMKDHVSEQLTLFASIVKWSAYASIVGVLAGGGTALFLMLLSKSTAFAAATPNYQFFLPLFLLASSALVRYLAPGAAGHGTEKVIEAVHQNMGRIPFRVVPVKLVATVITLASGGSAGKEGPCAQIGAGLASVFATIIRYLNRTEKARHLRHQRRIRHGFRNPDRRGTVRHRGAGAGADDVRCTVPVIRGRHCRLPCRTSLGITYLHGRFPSP